MSIIDIESTLAMEAMPVAELCAEFATETEAIESGFRRLGRLYYWLQKRLDDEAEQGKPKRFIYQVLTEAGANKGAISNASYAAKAYARTRTGSMTEEEYDTLTFRQCFALATGSHPRRQSETSPSVSVQRNAAPLPVSQAVVLTEAQGDDDERARKYLKMAGDLLVQASTLVVRPDVRSDIGKALTLVQKAFEQFK